MSVDFTNIDIATVAEFCKPHPHVYLFEQFINEQIVAKTKYYPPLNDPSEHLDVHNLLIPVAWYKILPAVAGDTPWEVGLEFSSGEFLIVESKMYAWHVESLRWIANTRCYCCGGEDTWSRVSMKLSSTCIIPLCSECQQFVPFSLGEYASVDSKVPRQEIIRQWELHNHERATGGRLKSRQLLSFGFKFMTWYRKNVDPNARHELFFYQHDLAAVNAAIEYFGDNDDQHV